MYYFNRVSYLVSTVKVCLLFLIIIITANASTLGYVLGSAGVLVTIQIPVFSYLLS